MSTDWLGKIIKLSWIIYAHIFLKHNLEKSITGIVITVAKNFNFLDKHYFSDMN